VHQAHPATSRLRMTFVRMLAVAIVVAMLAGVLMLAAAVTRAAVSTNWAGYVSKGHGASARFGRVVGSWAQPTASCTHAVIYSAFWVGLGGYSGGATKLEQTGTEADCSKSGRPLYAAWYEILPNPPMHARLGVRPGDVIAASVTTHQTGVVLHLRNLTTGRQSASRFTRITPTRPQPSGSLRRLRMWEWRLSHPPAHQLRNGQLRRSRR
jgi:hypothetical protein